MKYFPAVVLGAGPAGLSSAIYLRRNAISVAMVGRTPSLERYTIDNYFGFPEPVSGKLLLDNGMAQAKRFGVEIINGHVLGYETENDEHVLHLADGQLRCHAVVLAIGAGKRKDPAIANVKRFEGKGISYCAICDAHSFKNSRVIVVGAGNYAAQEALVLAGHASSVCLISNAGEFEIDDNLYDLVQSRGVKMLNSHVASIDGTFFAEGVTLDVGENIVADGIFLAISEPSAGEMAMKMRLKTTPGGFIEVNPLTCETSRASIFAAGDCTGVLRQIAVAVGQGALAGVSASTYCLNRKA